LDFKHNLDQNKKLLPVLEVVNRADVNKAFRELQETWKEDIGLRFEENLIWNQFSDLTKTNAR
jgi:hypothetical protein